MGRERKRRKERKEGTRPNPAHSPSFLSQHQLLLKKPAHSCSLIPAARETVSESSFLHFVGFYQQKKLPFLSPQAMTSLGGALCAARLTTNSTCFPTKLGFDDQGRKGHARRVVFEVIAAHVISFYHTFPCICSRDPSTQRAPVFM